MPKRKPFSGKDFGEKILDESFKFSQQIKADYHFKKDKPFCDKLNNLRNDKNFREQWHLLWGWRDLPKDEAINFFRVQAFLRSKELLKRLEDTSKRIGASFDFVKDYFITGNVLNHKHEESDVPDSTIKEAIDELDKFRNNLSFISAWDIPLYGTNAYKNPAARKWVKTHKSLSSFIPESEHGLSEIFQERTYTKKAERITNIEAKKKKIIKTKKKKLFEFLYELAWKNVKPDDFSYIWPPDAAKILEDRENELPVIYFRIDLRKYTSNAARSLNKFIMNKRDELKKIKPETYIYFDSCETALMLSDLNEYKLRFTKEEKNKYKFKFTKEEIESLLKQISAYLLNQPSDAQDLSQFVSDKLILARNLKDNASKISFPQ